MIGIRTFSQRNKKSAPKSRVVGDRDAQGNRTIVFGDFDHSPVDRRARVQQERLAPVNCANPMS